MKREIGRFAQVLTLAVSAGLPAGLAAQLTTPMPTMPPSGDATMPPATTSPMQEAVMKEEARDAEQKTRAQMYTMRLSSIYYASRNSRFPADVRAQLKAYVTAVKAKLAEAKAAGDLAREALTEVGTLLSAGDILGAGLKLIDAINHLNDAAQALSEAESNLMEAEAYLKEMDQKYPPMPEAPEPMPAPEPAPAPAPLPGTMDMPASTGDMGDGGPILP